MSCACKAATEKGNGHSCCKSKSENYVRPGWDEYFLGVAEAISKRSTCLRRRYGAVIVKGNVIVGAGYNGAPRGEENCSTLGFCERETLNIPSGQMYEKCRAVHAEQNAVINTDPEKMVGAAIYIAGFEAKGCGRAAGRPCLLCKRMIKNARIERVVFMSPDGNVKRFLAPDLDYSEPTNFNEVQNAIKDQDHGGEAANSRK